MKHILTDSFKIKSLIRLSVLLCIFIFTTNKVYAQDSIYNVALSFFATLPAAMPGSEKDTPAQIQLGKKLYFETSMSINNSQSCNSCHNIINNAPGVDHLKVSFGASGVAGTRNAPTTWNAGLQVAQFWDGRAETLEQQAMFPVLNPVEMAMPSEAEVIKRLTEHGYLKDFNNAFPDNAEASPVNINNISRALAAFQRTLISTDRFDDYLAGNNAAINDEERAGLALFIEKGCVACHNGPLLGGQLFMKMGIIHPYPNKIDKGIALITKKPGDNYFFKVPSLRNVINTAPYFHDGAAATIEQAIKDTGWHQLGISLSEEEVLSIKQFFNTLNNQ